MATAPINFEELRSRLLDFFNSGQRPNIEVEAVENTNRIMVWLSPFVQEALAKRDAEWRESFE